MNRLASFGNSNPRNGLLRECEAANGECVIVKRMRNRLSETED